MSAKIYWTKRRKKLEKGDLFRSADLNGTISKEDTTNCIYKLYETIEIIVVIHTMPSYQLDNWREDNEALIKRQKKTTKETKDVMKTLGLYR